MARREVIVYRVCDRHHRTEVNAVSTEKISLNGHRYEIDLCQDHVDELHRQIHAFTDLGRQVGTPSVIDRARPLPTAEPPAVTRPAPAPVQAEIERQKALQRRDMPKTAERWTITEHALERMAQRQVDIYEVLMAAELPEHDNPAPDRRGQDRDDVRERLREDVKVFVNTRTLEVLTVARPSQSVKFLEPQKASA